uniref:Uncharacterized protein n=1 Tax=Panagrolaimus sp. JU765 TaxID=591449 RepID=A0AC34QV55_9BILA
MVGRSFRTIRMTLDTAFLYFFVEILLVQKEVFAADGIVLPLVYFTCLTSHLVAFYFCLPVFKIEGPVVVNHFLALLSIINLTAMLLFGSKTTLFFVFFLIFENILCRCGLSMIYGTFEGYFLEILQKKKTKR